MNQLFSVEHVVTLAIVAACTATVTFAARRHPGPWTLIAARILAVILIVNEVSWIANLFVTRTWSAQWGLPLAICDSASLVAAAALWTRRTLLVELTWFWGLAGSAQGLLTPDVGNWHFPSFNYIQYFVAHGGIVLAAFYLIVGLGLRPRAWSIPRIVFITLAYTLVVGVLDIALNGNYMYLRQKPQSATLLDLFGGWPYYMVTATGIAIAFFTLLDVPFWRSRRKRPVRDAAFRPATGATRAESIPPG